MSRTDAIQSALHAFVESRRAELDRMDDLRGWHLNLKFAADKWAPEVILDRPERETRVATLKRAV